MYEVFYRNESNSDVWVLYAEGRTSKWGAYAPYKLYVAHMYPGNSLLNRGEDAYVIHEYDSEDAAQAKYDQLMSTDRYC